MRTRKTVFGTVVVGMVAVLGLGLALAQEAQAPARGQREGAGGAREGARPAQRAERPAGERARRFDPAQMRQRMEQRMKEALGVTDEEWKVLQPRLEKVTTLSRETRSAGGMRMLFGRGGRRDRRTDEGEATRPPSEVAKALQALQTTLENKEAAPEEIKAKLTALREAREKAKQELAKAQDALREIVTQRQEAQLVMMGHLN